MTEEDHKAKIHQDAYTCNCSAEHVVQNVGSLYCPGVDWLDQSAV